MEVFRTAVALMVRSMVVSAQSAGQQRLLFLQRAVAGGETVGELARLREENRRLKAENRLLQARFGDAPSRKRYTPMQCLQCQIPNCIQLNTPRDANQSRIAFTTPATFGPVLDLLVAS